MLTIKPPSIAGEEAERSAFDAAKHLARHGIKATPAETMANDLDAATVILNHAADLGADLVVIGGYGHSRMRELVLGGVTRFLLQHMTVPVLMSH